MQVIWLVSLMAQIFFRYISAKRVICYHGVGGHGLQISDVPAELCDIYLYAFAGVNPNTSEVLTLNPEFDIEKGGYFNATDLRKKNPNLKVILSVGGWGEDSGKYSDMVANAKNRSIFIKTALKLVQTYSFDGIDMDWEYPNRRDTHHAPHDKENFVNLIKELAETLHPLGLLVSAAVSAAPSTIDISYDVPALSKYLDIINVMTYDFHGAFDDFVGHNSPLYDSARFANTEYEGYSINASMLGWLERGANVSKVSFGIPFYGKSYNLTDASKSTPGSPATFWAAWEYPLVLQNLNTTGWILKFDEEQQVPYAYKGDLWLSYDTPESVIHKINFVRSLGIDNIMFWSIENDDFNGVGGTKYPLLKTIHKALD